MTGKDAKRCKKCWYSGYAAGETTCDYIGMTETPRCCPPGLECTKFKPKNGKNVRERNPALNPARVRVEKKREKLCKECEHRMTKYRDGKVISYCPLLDKEVDPDVTACRIIP